VKTIYLCGPILSRTKEKANEWRDYATSKLKKKFTILNPMRRQFSDADLLGVNEIVLMDKADVKQSDIILVNYNCARQETTLCGTAMEVFLAHSLGKYVVAFTDLPEGKWSPWMAFHCTRICKGLDDAIKYIDKHF
jgi:nucleoside 2-deoxyribosyltransferase